MEHILQQLEETLQSKIGCNDRTLCEYIYSLGKKGKQYLNQELNEFPPQFIDELYFIVNGGKLPVNGEKSQNSIYLGSVIAVKPFGVLVKVPDLNRTGLIPASHLSNDQKIRRGQTLHVKIESMNEKRLILKIEDMLEIHDPFELKQIQASQSLTSTNVHMDDADGNVFDEPDAISLCVKKHVPSFLKNEPDLKSVLESVDHQAATIKEDEGWLDKSARITGKNVSEATSKMRTALKNTQISESIQQNKRVLGNTDNEKTFEQHILPVHKYKNEIIQAVASNSVIVVVGDTGSGKTTQITQFLYDAGYSSNGKIIACTQPRRLAAISIAKRVGEEMGNDKMGELVGYAVRFDDCTSEKTEVKFMTDGILQREIISDPDLTKYSAIMLDEAHERTIATDVLFALLKGATTRRPDLKVIVTSATLDAERFAQYFGNGTPILRIPGRTFPVEIRWAQEPILDYMEEVMRIVKQIHSNKNDQGDILVFLTGQSEIDLAVSAISKAYPSGDLIPVPVYAAIPSEMQALVFNPAPPGKRKVVFATNIAETSLTINGIVFVVDPGFTKVQVWDANKGMGVLQVQPISQAQANQRSGRAGRTAPGVCFRLYTKYSFEHEMQMTPVPEIQRGNLGHTVLGLKSMGISDIMNFDFIDKPSKVSMMKAMNELFLLGALDENANITETGKEMSKFPLDPSLAKVVVTATDYGSKCLQNILTVISMMSMPNVFYRPANPPAKQQEADRAHRQFNDILGDHVKLLRVYNTWAGSQFSRSWCEKNFIQYKTMTKVLNARKQLVDIIQKNGRTSNKTNNGLEGHSNSEIQYNITKGEKSNLLKCLCTGFFQNVAKSSDGRGNYTTLTNNLTVNIHPSSCLFKKDAKYVLYSYLILTSKEYMHTVSEIKPEWLITAVPDYYEKVEENSEGSRKRPSEESLQPLYKKYAVHENEWKVSEHRKTLMNKKYR